MGFQLIANSGVALDCFNTAINLAEDGKFDEAEAMISEGEKSLVEAHKTQTSMLVSEANNEDIAFSIIMMHAQDHLMTTVNFERLAKRFIKLYQTLKEKGINNG